MADLNSILEEAYKAKQSELIAENPFIMGGLGMQQGLNTAFSNPANVDMSTGEILAWALGGGLFSGFSQEYGKRQAGKEFSDWHGQHVAPKFSQSDSLTALSEALAGDKETRTMAPLIQAYDASKQEAAANRYDQLAQNQLFKDITKDYVTEDGVVYKKVLRYNPQTRRFEVMSDTFKHNPRGLRGEHIDALTAALTGSNTPTTSVPISRGPGRSPSGSKGSLGGSIEGDEVDTVRQTLGEGDMKTPLGTAAIREATEATQEVTEDRFKIEETKRQKDWVKQTINIPTGKGTYAVYAPVVTNKDELERAKKYATSAANAVRVLESMEDVAKGTDALTRPFGISGEQLLKKRQELIDAILQMRTIYSDAPSAMGAAIRGQIVKEIPKYDTLMKNVSSQFPWNVTAVEDLQAKRTELFNTINSSLETMGLRRTMQNSKGKPYIFDPVKKNWIPFGGE